LNLTGAGPIPASVLVYQFDLLHFPVNNPIGNLVLSGTLCLVAAGLVVFARLSEDLSPAPVHSSGSEASTHAKRNSGRTDGDADDRPAPAELCDHSGISLQGKGSPSRIDKKPVTNASTASSVARQPLEGIRRSFESRDQARSGNVVKSGTIKTGSQEIESGAFPENPALIPPVVIEKAPVPVAVAVPSLDTSLLSPEERTAVQQVGDSFAASIAASPTQDPDSPAYFNYWKSAAYLHDEQLRITLGWESFNRLSALAAQASERTR
jgi:hypothetical protein